MAYFRPQPSVFLLMCLPSGPIALDPKDSYLLALAEASQAEFLVTGDRQLLSLKQHQSTRIITAAAMVEFLQEAASGGRGTSEAMATVQPSVQSACICFKSSRSRALDSGPAAHAHAFALPYGIEVRDSALSCGSPPQNSKDLLALFRKNPLPSDPNSR